jgi:glycosyltransferase involved in cell wall biosynthesis
MISSDRPPAVPRTVGEPRPRPVRVLYVSPRLPPPGGIATLMEILVQNGLPGDFRIEVVNTAARGRKMHAGPSLTVREVGRNIAILLNLAKTLLFFRPDIVHVNCSVARTGIFRDLLSASAARLAGARVLTHYHGSICRFVEKPGVPVAALHGLIARSGANVASNARDLAYVRLSGRARGGTYCLPNYVDVSRVSEPSRTPRPAPPRLQAIYVGALTRPKGAHDIVEVARRRPGIDFTLVSASVVDSFRPVMESLPSNVRVRVNLTDAELKQALVDSTFFMFLSYHEGFPLAVTEAMCAGLPIVATEVGSIPEMIDEGEGGFLCAPGDIGAALAALDKLVASPRLREMGQYNCRKARAQYTFEVVGARLVEIYSALLH